MADTSNSEQHLESFINLTRWVCDFLDDADDHKSQ